LIFRLTAGEVAYFFAAKKVTKNRPNPANLLLGDSGLRGHPGIDSLPGFIGCAFCCPVVIWF